jgi:hypothetical protein
VGQRDTGGAGNRDSGGPVGAAVAGDCGHWRSGGNNGCAWLEDTVVADMWALGPF